MSLRRIALAAHHTATSPETLLGLGVAVLLAAAGGLLTAALVVGVLLLVVLLLDTATVRADVRDCPLCARTARATGAEAER
ncbi:hypothetical protein [Streptomyces fradiae]|uniref:hypothetical protein n=1 Tax=Streptomyces fradiae TaxID=1906 RepID=UPI0035BE571A